MSKIAIITARGGSKRIPKKNIKEFCGKPIIAYSIQAAIDSNVFDEVMVSTDSEEIKTIAINYGANVPFLRSDVTSSDFATTADVITEVVSEYQKRGNEFDTFACIYPTAPFITKEKLRKANQMMEVNKAEGVVSVVKYSFPPQRAYVIKDGFVKFQYPQYEKARSQDLEPIYHDCGQFYFGLVKRFEESHSMIHDKMVPFVLPEEEVQDIDTISDWLIAEAKYQVMIKKMGR